MIQLFISGGVMMWPIVLIIFVVAGLATRTAVALLRGHSTAPALVQNGLDGLLFWGALAAILGVLGQVHGYYIAMLAMATHGLSSYTALWMGMAEGFVSTIFGLAVLSLAGILWYLLRWRFLAIRRGL